MRSTQNHSLEFSLCLSRAYLGKMMHKLESVGGGGVFMNRSGTSLVPAFDDPVRTPTANCIMISSTFPLKITLNRGNLQNAR
eukprot:COSAG06_NODE_322_length_17565_cov_152.607752_11_plen_82_part_00